jgi:hypothetical protein
MVRSRPEASVASTLYLLDLSLRTTAVINQYGLARWQLALARIVAQNLKLGRSRRYGKQPDHRKCGDVFHIHSSTFPVRSTDYHPGRLGNNSKWASLLVRPSHPTIFTLAKRRTFTCSRSIRGQTALIGGKY